MIVTIFRYIEPLWLGNNKKVSIRRVLALCFSYDFIRNTSYAIFKWEVGISYADIAMLLGIEAALIAALLALTTYTGTTILQNRTQNNLPTEDSSLE